jgi:O-antigen biosynthesis protein
MTKKTLVYTAIFGEYDELKPVAKQDIDCDFICFSDKNYEQKPWRIVHIPRKLDMHPRMQAKWFKLMAHDVFPNGRLAVRFDRRLFNRTRYDAAIWADGSLKIVGSSFARDVAALTRNGALAIYVHPDRDCIYDEVNVSLSMAKYQGLPLIQQVESYRAAGHPENAGLYACGVLGRKLPILNLQKRFDEAWWQENIQWAYQDQLSFAFLARNWALPIAPITTGTLWNNPYFYPVAHTSEL